MLNWLSTLPPLAVYVVLALLAAVENIIPPVPADMAVALGAFLTHRGVTTLPMVFAVTWGANVLGAVGVGKATAKSMMINMVLIHVLGVLTTQLFWGLSPNAPIAN